MLFVRNSGVVTAHAPSDFLEAAGSAHKLSAASLVAPTQDGPFEPLGRAIETNGRLRDRLAEAIPIPSLGRHYGRLRLFLLGLIAPSMVMLLELDRELAGGGDVSVLRVVVDLILVAYAVWELTRRTPRMPIVLATSLLAISLRWGLILARLCGAARVFVYVGAALPLLAAVVVMVRLPSRARVSLELLGKLGISRSDFYRVANDRPEAPAALIAAAVGIAAALPAMLIGLRALGAGPIPQAIAFLLFALIVPELARRTMDSGTGYRPAAMPPRSIMNAVILGIAVTSALVTAGRLFFDTGTEIARCAERLDKEAAAAHAAEAIELTRAVTNVRASILLVLLAAIVFPFGEERIYRGLLQDTITRRYGKAYGIFASALGFGLAHVGIYHMALYQTVLLGIGFGLAYAEGGLLAAFMVHATWNILQLAL